MITIFSSKYLFLMFIQITIEIALHFVQKNEKGSERPLSWLIFVQCQVKRKANCLINNLTLRERRYFAIFYSFFDTQTTFS